MNHKDWQVNEERQGNQTCLRSCLDKFDMAKNFVASFPVMRPSPSEQNAPSKHKQPA